MRNRIKHIKKNDMVEVISGKHKKKVGKVLRVLHKKGQVVVEKINMVTRHTKAQGKEPGGIIKKEAPLDVCKVLLYSEAQKKGLRVGMRFDDGGKKIRSNKKHQIDL